MTNGGQTLLREVGEAYIQAGYPAHEGWYVIPQDQAGALAFRELYALGHVQPLAGGWALTTMGLHAVLTAHPMTERAKALLARIREAYIQAGYPAREGWYVQRSTAEELPAFMELQSRGFLTAFGTGYQMWFVSEGGLRTILAEADA